MTPYVGTVQDGRFIPDEPEAYYADLRRREGKRVVQTLKAHHRKRTNPMNKNWWGVPVRMFAEAMGCSPEEAHDALKYECNYELHVVGERAFRIPRSTADLDMDEWKAMWARAQRLGVEMFNMIIPDMGSPEAESMADERLTP